MSYDPIASCFVLPQLIQSLIFARPAILTVHDICVISSRTDVSHMRHASCGSNLQVLANACPGHHHQLIFAAPVTACLRLMAPLGTKSKTATTSLPKAKSQQALLFKRRRVDQLLGVGSSSSSSTTTGHPSCEPPADAVGGTPSMHVDDTSTIMATPPHVDIIKGLFTPATSETPALQVSTDIGDDNIADEPTQPCVPHPSSMSTLRDDTMTLLEDDVLHHEPIGSVHTSACTDTVAEPHISHAHSLPLCVDDATSSARQPALVLNGSTHDLSLMDLSDEDGSDVGGMDTIPDAVATTDITPAPQMINKAARPACVACASTPLRLVLAMIIVRDRISRTSRVIIHNANAHAHDIPSSCHMPSGTICVS